MGAFFLLLFPGLMGARSPGVPVGRHRQALTRWCGVDNIINILDFLILTALTFVLIRNGRIGKVVCKMARAKHVPVARTPERMRLAAANEQIDWELNLVIATVVDYNAPD